MENQFVSSIHETKFVIDFIFEQMNNYNFWQKGVTDFVHNVCPIQGVNVILYSSTYD